MSDFTDFHCHLLPALDDGAADPEESLRIARSLASFGFATVHCTPHFISGHYEILPERVRKATLSLQRLLLDRGIELRLLPGTEHYLDEGLFPHLARHLPFPEPFLVEFPFRGSPELVRPQVQELCRLGIKPLIAHPERCSLLFPPRGGVRALFRRKEVEESLLRELRSIGCRFQGNLGSFAGLYGAQVKERALSLLAQGLYSCLGSDAHRAETLTEVLEEGYRVVVQAVGEDAAHRLLRGEVLNPCPAVQKDPSRPTS